jgi:signal transduction histidine kinase
VFLFLSVISAMQLFGSEDTFVVYDQMRFKPATTFLSRIEGKDTMTHELLIKNNTAEKQAILLEMPIQQLDRIFILQQNDTALLKHYFFESKKISNRIYYDRNIVIPFDMDANSTNKIVFKYHRDDIHNFFDPDILIWKKDAKLNRMQALELTRGVFYGILILYTFICFLVTYLIGIRKYYYYLFYLMAGVFYLFIKNNLGYELFWPDSPMVDIFLKKIMLSVYLLTSILFLRGFIQKRIHLPELQNILRYFIYFGILLVVISLMVGLLSTPAQKTFILLQNIFAIVCISTVLVTFVFVYFNTNDRSIVLFGLAFFLSFSFFLFYPQPEFGSSVLGVFLGQIYTYSNAFIIAAVICFSTVYSVIRIIKHNELLKKEMSLINSYNNFSLIEGQQNERTRVGRELHDGIGIMMSAVKMKMSAVKTTDKQEAAAFKKIILEIDTICDNIRSFSHTLLPPTLKKFGIQAAIKDMLEEFKQQQHVQLQYNFNISDNVSPVSQQLIFDILKHTIHYFTLNKPEQLTISIYVLPSINEAQIRIQHTGTAIHMNDENIKVITSVIDLLNGKFQVNLMNAWNFRIHMEFPILTVEHTNGNHKQNGKLNGK